MRENALDESGFGKAVRGAEGEWEGNTFRRRQDFLEQAGEGEYCFVENTGLQAVEAKIEKIIVFWWNRHYPSDRKFDLDLSKWNKVSEEEFAGYSHEKITKEVYEK